MKEPGSTLRPRREGFWEHYRWVTDPEAGKLERQSRTPLGTFKQVKERRVRAQAEARS